MADRRERLGGDPAAAFRIAFQGMQADLWTTLPVAVVEYNPAFRTVKLQPLIKGGIPNAETREMEWIDMPILLDCPVIFPGGGGYLLTFPLLPGDEGLVLISSRCIDGWWEMGGIQPQTELRMHDLSDGFFLPGIESKPSLTPDLSPTAAQLRSKDGTTSVSLGPEGVNVTSLLPINVQSTTMITLTAPIILANGVPIP